MRNVLLVNVPVLAPSLVVTHRRRLAVSLVGCLVRQVKSWIFPTSGAPTSVAAYPFVFAVDG